jgi:hypothetical protein
MTVCCQCGRHYWPGKNECPGRAQQINAEAVACNHKPCKKCQHYVDEKEKDYGKRKPRKNSS